MGRITVCFIPSIKKGSFSEHLDQLTPRGEGVESPDSTSHTSADHGPPSTSLRPESAVEKSGAVPKVPKSVSTGALSLMIPGGKFKKKTKHTHITMLMLPQNFVSYIVDACGSNNMLRITVKAMDFKNNLKKMKVHCEAVIIGPACLKFHVKKRL